MGIPRSDLLAQGGFHLAEHGKLICTTSCTHRQAIRWGVAASTRFEQQTLVHGMQQAAGLRDTMHPPRGHACAPTAQSPDCDVGSGTQVVTRVPCKALRLPKACAEVCCHTCDVGSGTQVAVPRRANQRQGAHTSWIEMSTQGESLKSVQSRGKEH